MEQENRMQAMQPEESKSMDDKKNGGAAVSRKTDFIPNPLPGPKPHVKREMKFDYEVTPEKMRFDIEKPDRMYYDYD